MSVNPTPDGIRFVFGNTPDIAHALIDFILFEQKCCSSILYELRSAPPHTQFTLQLHAPKHQVDALQAIYLHESLASTLATRQSGVARRFRARLENISEAAGPFGALICAIICLGMPVVSAILGVVGAGFLRDDRLLIPCEVLWSAMLLWSLIKGRRSHGNSLAMRLGLCAVGAFLGSMFISGLGSKISVGLGFLALSASLLLNRHFSLRCGCSSEGLNTSEAVRCDPTHEVISSDK